MKVVYLKKLSFIVILVVSLIQTNCQKNNEASPYMVKLATSTALGNYLTDRDGYALYYFSNDYNGRRSCFGDCASLWPPFYASGLSSSSLGPGLDIADFDTIVVSGVAQTRYKSWPLYYYAPKVNNQYVRESAGQTTGEAVGNIWYVGKPDYSVMLVNAQLVGNDGNNYTGSYEVGTGKTLYFTDPRGVTLYAFSKDSLDLNKFTKSDFSNNSVWPIYEANSEIVVPSTLDKALFDIIDVYGVTQLTYKGWPVYYFGGDHSIRGNNKGVSVPTPGIWPVLVKDMSPAPAK